MAPKSVTFRRHDHLVSVLFEDLFSHSYNITFSMFLDLVILYSWTTLLLSTGLRRVADEAMQALRGMRDSVSAQTKRDKKRPKGKLDTLFHQCKKKKTNSWKHRFICLALYGQEKIPTTDEEKDDLYKAGLGEKVIEFPDLDVGREEFRSILFQEFPKLEDGGGLQTCCAG